MIQESFDDLSYDNEFMYPNEIFTDDLNIYTHFVEPDHFSVSV